MSDNIRNRVVICILLVIILWILIGRSHLIYNIDGMTDQTSNYSLKRSESEVERPNSDDASRRGLNFRAFVINMDKDTVRYEKLLKYYQHSDLSNMPLTRYPAVVGKNEVPEKWLTDDALTELRHIIKYGFRTHHHQLTYGGIGCFLSHYNLAKHLLSNNSVDMYLILEDDTALPRNLYAYIQEYMKDVPDDWDCVLFYTIRAVGHSENDNINKIKSFWGMNGYLINRKGAQKFVDEVDTNRIDGQVDSYISRMIQQDKLNVYATKKHLVTSNSSDTNIQAILKPLAGVNPFNYRGYII